MYPLGYMYPRLGTPALIGFTWGSLIIKGQIQVCIRLKAEVGYLP